jgi:hypothetical protein
MSETKESLIEKIASKVSEAFLAKEVKLEKAKLVDGTEVEIEGENLFVLTEDGERLPAPVGEHELETGEIVVVQEEGKIAEKKAKEQEMEKNEEKMEFASKEEVAELKKQVDELKAMMKPKDEEELSKEEPKEVEASKVEPKPEEVKEEPVKAELSEEPKKVNHSPEKHVKSKKQNLSKVYGTTKERVMARIANL